MSEGGTVKNLHMYWDHKKRKVGGTAPWGREPAGGLTREPGARSPVMSKDQQVTPIDYRIVPGSFPNWPEQDIVLL